MAVMVSNWKTTLVGFTLIALGISGHYTGLEPEQSGACIATGLGLVCAKDAQ